MIVGLQEWNFECSLEPLKVANLWHMFKPFVPHTLVRFLFQSIHLENFFYHNHSSLFSPKWKKIPLTNAPCMAVALDSLTFLSIGFFLFFFLSYLNSLCKLKF